MTQQYSAVCWHVKELICKCSNPCSLSFASPDANHVFIERCTAFRIAVTTLTSYFDCLLTAVSGLRFYGVLGRLVW
jgi:hypothetical protein